MSTKEKNDSGRLNTIIGSGSVFEGTVHIESGGIRVDGKVKGKLVSSETLVVGPTGVFEANIQVKRATVGGRVVGSLVAVEQAVLESKAVLLGDLKTSNLVVHEGAIFNGNCSMSEEKSLLEKRDKLYTPVSEDETQDQDRIKKTF
jgi:cytoskeletal protein CcmA (bactofilin family)